ncbi:hypothetical protein WJX84_006607 [Apatococcus fuscideae]|uniref:Uncharacterized protein n=1 Tax=Apatococcus fuscideae TaxID=2026836 RepID=A0AAW1TC40_9CHLO
MAEDDTTRRPKRRCARKQSVVPSAVHYVGYVEEDETPEMIMKKFEELERVMATSTAERPAEAGPSSASTELEDLGGEPALEELAADQEAEERTLTEAQLMEGLFINAGWAHVSGQQVQDPLDRLAKLPIPQLCPIGFVFIFADKEHISGVVKQMYKWKFIYIENLTWIFLHANNSILRLPSPYARRSHLTMLMFRREGLAGKRIELRHQRNPDAAFDCIAASPGQPHATPEEVFIAIETLLPTGKGEFLELWAAKGASKEGWTHVAQCDGNYK